LQKDNDRQVFEECQVGTLLRVASYQNSATVWLFVASCCYKAVDIYSVSI